MKGYEGALRTAETTCVNLRSEEIETEANKIQAGFSEGLLSIPVSCPSETFISSGELRWS